MQKKSNVPNILYLEACKTQKDFRKGNFKTSTSIKVSVVGHLSWDSGTVNNLDVLFLPVLPDCIPFSDWLIPALMKARGETEELPESILRMSLPIFLRRVSRWFRQTFDGNLNTFVHLGGKRWSNKKVLLWRPIGPPLLRSFFRFFLHLHEMIENYFVWRWDMFVPG